MVKGKEGEVKIWEVALLLPKYHRPTEELNKEIDARVEKYLEHKKTIETASKVSNEKEPATFRDTKKPKFNGE